MAKDYRGFEDSMKGDVGKAALQMSTLEGGESGKGGKHAGSHTQTLRVRGSDLPRMIPAGAAIEFEAVSFQKLRFGDILFMRFDKELCLRRYINMTMKRDGTTDLHVTQEGPNNMVQILPSGALIGRVVGAEYRGKKFDPRKVETLQDRIRNKLTLFGTTTPWERVLESWGFFRKMLKK